MLLSPYYLCNMKMRNDDLKAVTEIKQYLLDPPVSFKLYDLALVYIQDVINILIKYPDAKNVTDDFQSLLLRLKNKEILQSELRSTLKDAGIKISRLTSR